MPRRVQDIIPGDRRSIRDSQPKKEPRASDSHKSDGRKVSLRRLPLTPPPPVKKKLPKAKRFIWASVLIVVVAALAGWAASINFSRATFVLTARTVPIPVDATIVASGTSSPGYVSYQIMSFNASASTTVPATDGPAISAKAHGSVIIYNAYSTTTQRLVAGTRLADDSGMIYRLNGSVVVPGYTLSNGTNKPGSLTTSVVADQAGDIYNLSKASSPSDFKFIAYEGTPKYTGFYAKLATDISGGASGQKKTVDPGALASTTAILKTRMTAQLLAKAESAVPSDSIMYDGAYATYFMAPSVGGGSANSASVSVQGTLYSILFKKADLLAKLAGPAALGTFGSFSYSVPGLDALSFTVNNARDFSPQNKSVLIARFSGAIKLVGIVPAAEIKQKVAGLPLSQTGDVLRTYSSVIDIEKSTGELSPPWVSRVPTDLRRISVEVENGS